MQRVIRKLVIGSVIAIALTAWLHAAAAPVADAAMARDREAVKTLLKGGADIDHARTPVRGRTAKLPPGARHDSRLAALQTMARRFSSRADSTLFFHLGIITDRRRA